MLGVPMQTNHLQFAFGDSPTTFLNRENKLFFYNYLFIKKQNYNILNGNVRHYSKRVCGVVRHHQEGGGGDDDTMQSEKGLFDD